MNGPTAAVFWKWVATREERHRLRRWHSIGERLKDLVPEVVEDLRALCANRFEEPRANRKPQLLRRVLLRLASGHGENRSVVAKAKETSSDRIGYKVSAVPACTWAKCGQIQRIMAWRGRSNITVLV